MLLGLKQTMFNTRNLRSIPAIKLGHNFSYLRSGIYLSNLQTF